MIDMERKTQEALSITQRFESQYGSNCYRTKQARVTIIGETKVWLRSNSHNHVMYLTRNRIRVRKFRITSKGKRSERERETLSLRERGGRIIVPFFCRTLPILLPAVAASVRQMDSHISQNADEKRKRIRNLIECFSFTLLHATPSDFLLLTDRRNSKFAF